MSQQFECWHLDYPGEVTKLEAHSHGDAAEKFCESNWHMDRDESYEVGVRDSFGAVKEFTVDVDLEPEFCAFEIKKPKHAASRPR